jgi:hypothetical protein
MMGRKAGNGAQGSLEYLLLIGGALIVVAVVIAIGFTIIEEGQRLSNESLKRTTTIIEESLLPFESATNLVQNPGFEEGITGWSITDPLENSGAVTEDPYAGSYSLRLGPSGAGAWQYVIQSVDVTKGETYVLKFVAKYTTTAPEYVWHKKGWLSDSGPARPTNNSCGGVDTVATINTESWKLYTIECTPSSSSVDIGLSFSAEDSFGKIYVDSVRFYKK